MFKQITEWKSSIIASYQKTTVMQTFDSKRLGEYCISGEGEHGYGIDPAHRLFHLQKFLRKPLENNDLNGYYDDHEAYETSDCLLIKPKSKGI